ncbi:MAG: peptidoglycan editing factor PgeF [Pseudomonadota bacterium]
MQLVKPGWAAPGGLLARKVTAFTTARTGGVSAGEYASLNLGNHVGDAPDLVDRNRALLTDQAEITRPLLWLEQVHGTQVIHADDWKPGVEADAIVSDKPQQPLVIMTADCLPILLASRQGSEVAAIHAGWRGLADGVVANTVAMLQTPPQDLVAWIGPSISQPNYEVDETVRDAFVANDHRATNCFLPNARGRWFADLKTLAVIALRSASVRRVTDANLCTYQLADRFFSHRREAPCGRMASVIQIAR